MTQREEILEKICKAINDLVNKGTTTTIPFIPVNSGGIRPFKPFDFSIPPLMTSRYRNGKVDLRDDVGNLLLRNVPLTSLPLD